MHGLAHPVASDRDEMLESTAMAAADPEMGPEVA